MPHSTALRLGTLAAALTALLAPAVGRAEAPAPAPGASGPGALALGVSPPGAPPPAKVLPNRLVVEYAPGTPAAARAAVQRTTGTAPASPAVGRVRVLKIRDGDSVAATVAELRRRPDVVAAAPDFVAHAGAYEPRDPGFGGLHGWERAQWNFLAPSGVDAPDAWSHLRHAHAPGGQGVTVAVLDTGVAYRNWRGFRRSPDFARTRFARGWDFVRCPRGPSRPCRFAPVDRNGHGTHVTGTIAEQTDNRRGVTGLAYGARVMPVRVLDDRGYGDAVGIARGIRFAASHGAQVINLSLEFSVEGRWAVTSAHQIPAIVSALDYAHRRRVVVVAAAGNDAADRPGYRAPVAYPARARHVVAVGATTSNLCRADYSNDGAGLDLVAPGGGFDDPALSDPGCHTAQRVHRDIFQTTFLGSSRRRFGLPTGWYGTSMAAPHVAAAAALVIASRVIGRRPSPTAIERRLKATTRDLGAPGYDAHYGSGLIDAARATRRP